jgi:serine/threonine protein kinase/Tol biopolymer transport system component
VDPRDRAARVAARIADDSTIDWTAAAAEAATPDDRALVDELRTIAEIATLHRAPVDSSADGSGRAPEVWGSLTLLSRIGEGRFGDVHIAWDARLQRRVALKLIRVSSASLASPTKAIDEARLLARVRHPNVLTVFGAEFHSGQAGIWTEYIEGRTLSALIADHGPLAPDDVTRVGLNLCAALGAVHGAGLLHRDIKAQNVMRETGGRIVLMDFGTGHDLAVAPARPGDLSGTPLYLAPEVLTGAPASQASDIYALGVLLFHLVTGTFPVVGATLDEVQHGHKAASAQVPSQLRGVPEPLATAIQRALAPNPRERFAGADALAHALGRGHGSSRVLRNGIAAAAVLAMMVTGASALLPTGFSAAGDPAEFSRRPSHVLETASTVHLPLSPDTLDVGRPSRDGRFVPIVDRKQRVQALEIRSGTLRDLAGPLTAREGIEAPLLSPDGSHVVFTASEGNWSELRIVGSDSQHRVLIPREARGSPEALEWSRDGREIVCLVTMPDATTELRLVHVEGGSTRLLTWKRGRPRHASLSADDRFLVFDFPNDDRAGKRDILILDLVMPAPPRVLLGGSANNVTPIWTPGGDGVLFVSDRAGSMEGWVAPVSAGYASGAPYRVASHLSRAFPLGLTDDGRYFFLYQINQNDVYAVSVDASAGRTGARSRVSTSPGGGRIAPAWSPDGRFISYYTASGNTVFDRDSDTLTIQELATGRTRDVSLPMTRLGYMVPRWSPDSRRLLIRGRDLDGRQGFFIVDIRTYGVTPVVAIDLNQQNEYGAFDWAPDGRRIYYLRRGLGVIAHDLETHREDVIVPKASRDVAFSLVVSPDGSQIAFTSSEQNAGTTIIEVVTLHDRQRHDIHVLQSPTAAYVHAWTRDGRELLYTTATRGSDLPHRLWRISASGGEPHDMGLAIEGNTQANKAALSPAGDRLAFTEGVPEWQLWVMSDFLPAARRLP